MVRPADRSRQFHKLIRSKPSLPPAKDRSPILFRAILIRRSAAAYIKSLEFELILGNGKVYPHKGKFYALDRNLDPKTGSIRYEVTFPNPGNNLRPGQFGKVRFVADMKKGAMVIPQEAVNELQGSYQVAVVDQNNKVSIRPVKMGERIGAMWEVTEGFEARRQSCCARTPKSARRFDSHGERLDPSRRRVGFKSGPAKKP